MVINLPVIKHDGTFHYTALTSADSSRFVRWACFVPPLGGAVAQAKSSNVTAAVPVTNDGVDSRVSAGELGHFLTSRCFAGIHLVFNS